MQQHTLADSFGAYSPTIALIAIYSAVFGSLIAASDFLPYVMDNNETFSSLWHAASLYNIDLSATWGLADEALSTSPAAHPYVHTHQGNFPRLFAFAIYALGARTAEAQIVVTTFTVGLATIVLIFRFFARIANPWFALTVSIVFMTDYVLFTQWHVVTYRVWYPFLLFACLYCVGHPCWSTRSSLKWATALAFASLFYFELVFAVFVACFCGLYASALHWRARKQLAQILSFQFFGVALGTVVFATQAVGYLGWSEFLRDIYLTFVARNDFRINSTLLHDASEFYASHNVIFWPNIQERNPFATSSALARSLTWFDWRIHTPILSVAIWLVCLGWICGYLASTRLGNIVVRNVPTGAAYLVMFAGVSAFASNAFEIRDSLLTVGVLVFATVVVAIAVALVREPHASDKGILGRRGRILLLVIGCLLFLAALLLRSRGLIFGETFRPMWEELERRFGGAHIHVMIIGSAAMIGAYVAAFGVLKINGSVERGYLASVLVYLLCGLAAYSIVFFISPGYLYTGYLSRHAPFTVFLTDVLVASAMYISVCASIDLTRQATNVGSASGWIPAFLSYARYSVGAIAIGGTFGLVAYWLVLQVTYVRWMPPTHFAFLKSLVDHPYRGSSFLVDSYAAPVAAYTGQWAYFDPLVSQGRTMSSPEGIRLVGDGRFVWFADRGNNQDYQRPQYFLCMIQQSPSTVLARILSEREGAPSYPGCSSRPIIRMARDGEKPFDAFRLVAADIKGPASIGFDAWAIVELDWDTGAKPVTLEWNFSHAPGSYRNRGE